MILKSENLTINKFYVLIVKFIIVFKYDFNLMVKMLRQKSFVFEIIRLYVLNQCVNYILVICQWQITLFHYTYMPSCENILVLVDFNTTMENLHLNNLLQIFSLNLPINTQRCYPPRNPLFIDNILINQKLLFKLTKIFEFWLSYHHMLI